MIPRGWVLVPITPSERMLSEFAGHYWPHLPREKQDHERAAYNAMLLVVPTPPEGDVTEIEALKTKIVRLEGLLREADRRYWKELGPLKNTVGQLRKELRDVKRGKHE